MLNLELSLSGSLIASDQGSLTTTGELLNISALDCQETRTPVTFFSYSLTMDAPFFLSLTMFPLHVLPNRLYSPLPLVFVAASSLT